MTTLTAPNFGQSKSRGQGRDVSVRLVLNKREERNVASLKRNGEEVIGIPKKKNLNSPKYRRKTFRIASSWPSKMMEYKLRSMRTRGSSRAEVAAKEAESPFKGALFKVLMDYVRQFTFFCPQKVTGELWTNL